MVEATCPGQPTFNSNKALVAECAMQSRVGDGVNSCADIKCDQRGDLCLVATSSSDRHTHTKSPTVVENYDLTVTFFCIESRRILITHVTQVNQVTLVSGQSSSLFKDLNFSTTTKSKLLYKFYT